MAAHYKLFKTPLFWVSVISSAALATLGANDFRIYVEAAQSFLHSGWSHLYEPQSLTPFKYHPFFVIGYVPFATLPWIAAKVFWSALNGYFIYDAGIRFSRDFSLSLPRYTLGVLFVVHAMSWQLKFANVTFLILWLLAVSLSERENVVGIVSAILILLKPFFLPILLLQLLFKRYILLAKTCLIILGLSILPVLSGGGMSLFESWIAVLTNPQHAHNYGKNDNQTLYALLYRNRELLSVEMFWLLGSLVSGSLWVTTVLKKQYKFALLAMIPFILFAAPMSWIHHQVWLWPLTAALLVSPYWPMALMWILLNGVGELLIGRNLFVTTHQWGIPLLAYLLAQVLCLRNSSYNR